MTLNEIKMQNKLTLKTIFVIFSTLILMLILVIIQSDDIISSMHRSVQDKRSKNIIYYGSNINIGKEFNTKRMVELFQHPKNKSLVKRFPQCIIVGVGKCGTTALGLFLNYHPSFVGSLRLEPNFFGSPLFKSGYKKYLKLMDYSLETQITFVFS